MGGRNLSLLSGPSTLPPSKCHFEVGSEELADERTRGHAPARSMTMRLLLTWQWWQPLFQTPGSKGLDSCCQSVPLVKDKLYQKRLPAKCLYYIFHWKLQRQIFREGGLFRLEAFYFKLGRSWPWLNHLAYFAGVAAGIPLTLGILRHQKPCEIGCLFIIGDHESPTHLK